MNDRAHDTRPPPAADALRRHLRRIARQMSLRLGGPPLIRGLALALALALAVALLDSVWPLGPAARAIAALLCLILTLAAGLRALSDRPRTLDAAAALIDRRAADLDPDARPPGALVALQLARDEHADRPDPLRAALRLRVTERAAALLASPGDLIRATPDERRAWIRSALALSIPIGAVALALAITPGRIHAALPRLFLPWTDAPPYSPTSFAVTFSPPRPAPGERLHITVATSGESPQRLDLLFHHLELTAGAPRPAPFEIPTQRAADHTWTASLLMPPAGLRLCARADTGRSRWISITAHQPALQRVDIVELLPRDAQRPAAHASFTLDSSTDPASPLELSAAAGARVRATLVFSGTPAASTRAAISPADPGTWQQRLVGPVLTLERRPVLAPERVELAAGDRHIALSITTRADQPPALEPVDPRTAPDPQTSAASFLIRDDVGIARVDAAIFLTDSAGAWLAYWAAELDAQPRWNDAISAVEARASVPLEWLLSQPDAAQAFVIVAAREVSTNDEAVGRTTFSPPIRISLHDLPAAAASSSPRLTRLGDDPATPQGPAAAGAIDADADHDAASATQQSGAAAPGSAQAQSAAALNNNNNNNNNNNFSNNADTASNTTSASATSHTSAAGSSADARSRGRGRESADSPPPPADAGPPIAATATAVMPAYQRGPQPLIPGPQRALPAWFTTIDRLRAQRAAELARQESSSSDAAP